MDKRPTKLERIAYHEAGHAVVAYVLHRRTTSVSIVPDGDTLGRVRLSKLNDFNPDIDDDRRTREWTEREIMTFLGGLVAEAKLAGKHNYIGARFDLQAAESLAANMCGSEEETNAYFKWMWERTKGMLNHPGYWKTVEELASELIKEKRIGERRVRKIIADNIDSAMTAFREQSHARASGQNK